MVATHANNLHPKGDTELMAVGRDTLDMWLKTSNIPEGVSRFDVLRELENRERSSKAKSEASGTMDCSHETKSVDLTSMMNEWASFFEENDLDIVLATSSLTEGSDFLFENIDDARDDGTNSGCISDEQSDDNDNDNENDNDNDNDNEKNNNDASKKKSRPEHKQRVRSGTRVSSIKRLPPAKRDTVSYAQLFFDPETKSLVTLMEVAKNTASGAAKSGNHYRCHRCNLRKQGGFNQRGTPLHRSSLLLESKRTSYDFSTRVGTTATDDNEEWASIPFLDNTILTECSSISSASSQDTEEEDDHDGNKDWGFQRMGPSRELPWATNEPRYPEDPIVFSNDDSMGDPRLCWLEDAEIDLYLLHDCDDVWDYGTAKDSRCTDSLKKLLMASRLCISLPHIGELRWKASTGNHNTSGDFSFGNSSSRTKMERSSYAALADN